MTDRYSELEGLGKLLRAAGVPPVKAEEIVRSQLRSGAVGRVDETYHQELARIGMKADAELIQIQQVQTDLIRTLTYELSTLRGDIKVAARRSESNRQSLVRCLFGLVLANACLAAILLAALLGWLHPEQANAPAPRPPEAGTDAGQVGDA